MTGCWIMQAVSLVTGSLDILAQYCLEQVQLFTPLPTCQVTYQKKASLEVLNITQGFTDQCISTILWSIMLLRNIQMDYINGCCLTDDQQETKRIVILARPYPVASTLTKTRDRRQHRQAGQGRGDTVDYKQCRVLKIVTKNRYLLLL